MKVERKLTKLVRSMSEDEKRNDSIIKNNLDFLLEVSDNYNIIEMVLSLHIRIEKIRTFIVTFLKSLSFSQYMNLTDKKDSNGNNIFHLVAASGNVKFLNELIVFEKSQHKGWLSYHPPYLFFEEINNNGDTAFSMFLKTRIIFSGDDDSKEYIKLLKSIATDEIEYIIKNYDLILKKANEFKTYLMPTFELENMKNILADICYGSIISITKLFSDNKEENIALIEKIFGDVNYTRDTQSFLWKCIPDYGNVYLEPLDKLLEIGVDPNIRDRNGNDFIRRAMNKKFISAHMWIPSKNSKDIVRLLEKIVEHGYNINQKPNLMENVFDNYGFYFSSFQIYEKLCEFGFDVLEFDNKFWKYANKANKGNEDTVTLIYFHQKQVMVEKIIYEIKKNGFNIEEGFKEKFMNLFSKRHMIYYNEKNYRVNFLISWLDKDNDEFIQLLVKTIVEIINNSVNYHNNIITIDDLLYGVEIIINMYQNEVSISENNNKVKQLNK